MKQSLLILRVFLWTAIFSAAIVADALAAEPVSLSDAARSGNWETVKTLVKAGLKGRRNQ
jgi:hypothetical protein